jgi:ABC-type branched-subunit amino acid transport system substrate-binding protein
MCLSRPFSLRDRRFMNRDELDLGISRRRFLQLSGATLAAIAVGGSTAQDAQEVLKIGVVLPTKTGETPVRAATHQVAGEAALMGAIMAEELLVAASNRPSAPGLEVLVATAPEAQAALRAAERLVAAQQVFALVGGFGGQAEVLAEVAAENGLPYLNIGSPHQALRRPMYGRYTFSVEASAQMYLSAIFRWFAAAGARRWFLVYEDSLEGESLVDLSRSLGDEAPGGGCEMAAAAVTDGDGVYREVLHSVRRAEPEALLMLLDPVAQLDFLSQYETSGLTAQVTGFPYPVAQTREFLNACRHIAPVAGSGYRAMLWEGGIDDGDAGDLNRLFRGRWGRVMDPSAWAAYQAVGILYRAAIEAGTVSGSKLVSYLESPRVSFEIGKETAASFGATDHQLHQSLYMIEIQTEANTAVELARLQAVLHAESSGEEPNSSPAPVGSTGSRCQPS